MREPVVSLSTTMPRAGQALVRAVDRALAFDKRDRWQSAGEMFEALRVAYDEFVAHAMHPTASGPGASAPPRGRVASATTELAPSPPSPPSPLDPPPSARSASLVVEIAFGEERESAVALERVRTREVVDALSSISIAVDTEIDGSR